jgi:hypothetical protein
MMSPKQKEKVAKVYQEFKDKKLHSGKAGSVVKNPKQAVAIAMSEANMPKRGQRTATNRSKK